VPERGKHVQWWPVGRELFTELGHPVVVEEEVLSAGQGVPRLCSFHVDGERGVASAPCFAAGPLRRGNNGLWSELCVLEQDAVAGAFFGKVSQGRAGLLFQLMECDRGDSAVGRAGQRQDGFTELAVPCD